MASATATKTSDPLDPTLDAELTGEETGRSGRRARASVRHSARRLWRDVSRSRIALFIIIANATALGVLILGVILNDGIRRTLTERLTDVVYAEASLLKNVIEASLVIEDAEEEIVLEEDFRGPQIIRLMRRLALHELARPVAENEEAHAVRLRVRVFDAEGRMYAGADTELMADRILVEPLEPIRPERGGVSAWFGALLRGRDRSFDAEAALAEEVNQALNAEADRLIQARQPIDSRVRFDEDGREVVSVALPIQFVSGRVSGVVVVEAANFTAVTAQANRAILPFIFMAVGVTLVSSLALTVFIARPIRILAKAAERVRALGPSRARIPDLSARNDEIGELSSVLASMTDALSRRMEAIEDFAADVAHELKNPLTSLRSALETLPKARNDEQRERLVGLMHHDIKRIDRLITDISRASRMDAELAREVAGPLDLRAALASIIGIYENTAIDRGVSVALLDDTDDAPIFVTAVEDKLGHVFRNLIDNAITFSPDEGVVSVRLEGRYRGRGGAPCAAVVVDDDGPGVPPQNLEKIFSRFYTRRPDGTAFGSHSGLGLAIARQVVEAVDGQIWAENRTDPRDPSRVTGARFVVCLPLRWR